MRNPNWRDEPTRFTVKGRGLFPIDMLRHDHCWPVDGDYNHISRSATSNAEASIVLCAQMRRCITPERWRSFGWVVTDIAGEEIY